jgi:hypothetical protein
MSTLEELIFLDALNGVRRLNRLGLASDALPFGFLRLTEARTIRPVTEKRLPIGQN